MESSDKSIKDIDIITDKNQLLTLFYLDNMESLKEKIYSCIDFKKLKTIISLREEFIIKSLCEKYKIDVGEAIKFINHKLSNSVLTNKEILDYNRCEALIKKKGQQCTRKKYLDTPYCRTHQDYVPIIKVEKKKKEVSTKTKKQSRQKKKSDKDLTNSKDTHYSTDDDTEKIKEKDKKSIKDKDIDDTEKDSKSHNDPGRFSENIELIDKNIEYTETTELIYKEKTFYIDNEMNIYNEEFEQVGIKDDDGNIVFDDKDYEKKF